MDRNTLTKAQRAHLSERLANERLETVNKLSAPVNPRTNFYSKYAKRALDFTLALLALTISLPINLVIGIITFFDVGRPIFFTQDRIGKDGKLFKIVKFRNMTNEKDERGELKPAAERVTKFGRFVRKTSLDELLNFWSILKGDMSLIGPRPLVPTYGIRFSDRHAQRTKVRPGLECPPRGQDIMLRTWHDQFENDIWYVENISFATDCKMLYYLVKFTFDRKNAAHRAGVRGSFAGYHWDGRVMSYEEVPQEYIDYYENEDAEQAPAEEQTAAK